MIDSHCHLADKQFVTDLDLVIARARGVGVERMVTIADSLSEGEKCLQIAEKYEYIFCTIGVHPHHAKDWSDHSLSSLRTLVQSSAKVRAVGEIGLDYHYDFSPREIQRAAFEEQLLLANALRMPSVVHCREAVEDVWAIVERVEPPRLVLHCCTEKWADVERFVQRGDFLSFTGIATYPHAQDIRETIKQCPITQLMIETDAPYLAPVPHRGTRNEPAFVVEVAKLIADLKGLTPAEVDAQTTKNTVEFFGLPS